MHTIKPSRLSLSVDPQIFINSFIGLLTMIIQYLPIAGNALAFILAAGIPWVNTRSAQKDDVNCIEEADQLQSDKSANV